MDAGTGSDTTATVASQALTVPDGQDEPNSRKRVGERLDALKASRRRAHKVLADEHDDLLDVATDLKARVEFLERENASLILQKLQATTRPDLPKFAVVLLDADSYVFKHGFMLNGTQGGRDAADELLSKVQLYLQNELNLDTSSMDIICKAYANHGGLANHLYDCHFIKYKQDFDLFVKAFNQRVSLFEFSDVGFGKERADHKIRKWLEHYMVQSQCAHVLLGCGHDSGYTTFLEEYGANERMRDRISIISGPIMNVEFRKLGLKRSLGLWTVFHETKVTRSFRSEAAQQEHVPQPPVTLTISAADMAANVPSGPRVQKKPGEGQERNRPSGSGGGGHHRQSKAKPDHAPRSEQRYQSKVDKRKWRTHPQHYRFEDEGAYHPYHSSDWHYRPEHYRY